MPSCVTHGIEVHARNDGRTSRCGLHGSKRVPERKFEAAVRQVAYRLHATIVEFEPGEKVAELRLQGKKKISRVLRCTRRAIGEAFAPRKHRRQPAPRSGRERPLKRQPVLHYVT